MRSSTRRLFAASLVVLGAGVAGAQTTPSMATTTTTSTNASSPAALAIAAEPTVERIVAIAQRVEPGATGVTAFTVPSGRQLVVTDVVITNPSATPVCGAAISPGAATATTSTTSTTPATTGDTTTAGVTPSTATSDTGTITSTGGSTTTTTPGGSTVTTPTVAAAAAVESGTGTLCVPAQTSLSLSLTTGLEFASGQTVVLANQPLTPATTTPATTASTTPTTAAAAATTTSGPLLYHLRGMLILSGV